MLYANNKGADQPAHLRSPISIFVVYCLDSIVPLLAKSKISKLQLVSVAVQAGLSLTRIHTSKDRFSCDVAQLCTSDNNVHFIYGHNSLAWYWPAQLQRLARGLKFWL